MPLPELRISSDRRRLEQANGAPFFYQAETAWEIFHRASREEAELLLRNRATKGFNVVQAVALAELDGLLTPNVYGERPFLGDGLDPRKPNPAFWAHVDWIVRKANELGLYVALLPSWGDKWLPRNWGAGPAVFNEESARAYAEWIGRRYATDAVIWVVGGDRYLRDAGDARLVRAFAEGLRAGDGGRGLLTFHPPGGASSSRSVHAEPWLDFHMIQSGHDRSRATWAMVEQDWDLFPVRPVVNGEPCYEAHPNAFRAGETGWLDQADVRRELYWSICDGAAGFAYGCHAIWQMWQPGREPVNSPRAPWRESLNLPGASQVQFGKRLALARPFYRKGRTWGVLCSPAGEGPSRVRVAADDDKSWLVAYLPEGQRVTLDVGTFLCGEELHVRWYNPRNGTTQDGGRFARGERMVFDAPFDGEGRDWVLLVDDSARAYPAP